MPYVELDNVVIPRIKIAFRATTTTKKRTTRTKQKSQRESLRLAKWDIRFLIKLLCFTWSEYRKKKYTNNVRLHFASIITMFRTKNKRS